MSKSQKRIDQLKLDLQVAVDEFNKIQEKMKELSVARDALKMKAFSCGERIKELEELNQDLTQTEVIN
jgi:flagellar biosynthesis chaperone FliJ